MRGVSVAFRRVLSCWCAPGKVVGGSSYCYDAVCLNRMLGLEAVEKVGWYTPNINCSMMRLAVGQMLEGLRASPVSGADVTAGDRRDRRVKSSAIRRPKRP